MNKNHYHKSQTAKGLESDMESLESHHRSKEKKIKKRDPGSGISAESQRNNKGEIEITHPSTSNGEKSISASGETQSSDISRQFSWTQYFAAEKEKAKWLRKTDCIVKDVYKIGSRLERGGQGEVFVATNMDTKKYVALKLQSTLIKPLKIRLEKEFLVSKVMAGNEGIAEVLWFEKVRDYKIMAMDLLGPQLQELKNDLPERRFTLKTVLMIADQSLRLIEKLHSSGYIHRDIKPQNFLVGPAPEYIRKKCRNRTSQIYMIDFGCAKRYTRLDEKTHKEKHYAMRSDRGFVGTLEFASVNAHLDVDLSRRDDLESLLYTLISFTHDGLPWRRICDSNMRDIGKKKRNVAYMKRHMKTGKLCSSIPKEFEQYFRYVKGLEFDEEPDYAYLRGLFRSVRQREGLAHDHVFDWDEKVQNTGVGLLSSYERSYGPLVYPEFSLPKELHPIPSAFRRSHHK